MAERIPAQQSSDKTQFYGLLCGVIAYGTWGLAPLYWRLYEGVSALELLLHRISWGMLILLIIISWRRETDLFKSIFARRKTVLCLLASSLLIFGNWFTFVYSVNHGHVLEASLGYYINPLMNVVLGALFFGERARKGQKAALLVALVAVLIALSADQVGRLDLSFALAGTFACYGLFRKLAGAPSLHGLLIEMVVALPLCLLSLKLIAPAGTGLDLHYFDFSLAKKIGLTFAGVLTVVPLFAFNEAVTRLPLTTMGILQYLAPSGQFLLGYFLFKEEVTSIRLIVFGLIWLALIMYSYEGNRHHRSKQKLSS